jgi:hypothetical protein
MASADCGTTTDRNAPHDERPRSRALSSTDGGREASRAATGRYTYG